ncbi:hypothetical protein D3C86_2115360 [compost metagenome]
MIVVSPPLAAVVLPIVAVGIVLLQIVSPVADIVPDVNKALTVIVPVALAVPQLPPVNGIV